MTRNEAECFANGFTQAAQIFGNIETVRAHGKTESLGWLDFVEAYSKAQDQFNNHARVFMPSCESAWHNWQESGGRTIDYL